VGLDGSYYLVVSTGKYSYPRAVNQPISEYWGGGFVAKVKRRAIDWLEAGALIQLIKGPESLRLPYFNLNRGLSSNQDRNDVTISVGMIELVPLLRRVSLAVDIRGGGDAETSNYLN
jgi:hypothetical protein